MLSGLHFGGTAHGGNILKIENGLVFSWTVNSRDTTANQLDIFGINGDRLVSLQILRPFDDAVKVSIRDASAKPNQFIVVSAVYVNHNGTLAASLLYFDWNGRLLQALALDPTREIWRLTVDDRQNVWTLTTHSGDMDPSKVPLIVEYDRSGRVERELLPRSLFPTHAKTLDESRVDGSAGFGKVGDFIWVWLPKSTDLILVNTLTGRIERSLTELPTKNDREQKLVPLGMAMLNSYSLIAEFRAEESATSAHLQWETWSPDAKHWKNLDCPDCSGTRLVGVADGELLFADPVGPDRHLYRRSVADSVIQ